jgi:hypothetical protein
MRGESGRNKIAKRFEETHKVKRRIYFVKPRILQMSEGRVYLHGLKPRIL